VVHDLAYLHTPEYVRTKNRKYLERFVPKSVKTADAVVAVSQTVKEDLVNRFNLDENKVFVAPNGVDEKRFARANPAKIRKVKEKYGIKGEYFLFVSTLEPRKNLAGLLGAYEKLGKKIPALVLAGGEGWRNDDAMENIKRMRQNGFSVITTGFVSDEDLPALYSGANMLVLPSHFEGFGLPIIEAMAAGIPVITSNKNPMKEVGGNAALYANPKDTDDIADKISLLYTDNALREQLVRRGRANIKRFSWEESAKVFKNLIRELAKE